MIAVDVEGSGTEYHLHSIVSIGAVDLSNPDFKFYKECRIWDGAKIMPDALKVCGFTEEEITSENKSSESEAVKSFIEWTYQVTDRTLAGQNVSYDRDMLKAATIRAKEPWPLAYRTIDTHSLCWMHMVKRGLPIPLDQQHQRSSLNLDTILNYCGIPEEPTPHNALTGALCHAEVISRLLYDQNLLTEFSSYKIPWVS